jgi:hypothetical protein
MGRVDYLPCDLIINPLKGDLEMNAPWIGKGSQPPVSARGRPDENGEFLLAFDESTYSGIFGALSHL